MSPLFAALAGLAAGGLHVLSGPDHLAAVAPLTGADPRHAARTGLSWGLGHGVGVLALGLVGLALGQLLPLESISSAAEVLAGLSLIIVGGWALRRALGLRVHDHEHVHDGTPPLVHAHPHLHRERSDAAGPSAHEGHSHAAAAVGLLHGLAGAGHLLAALPVLALGARVGAVYLASYLLSAIVVMTLVALALGLLQRTAERRQRLPVVSAALGGVAIVVGVGWVALTIVG